MSTRVRRQLITFAASLCLLLSAGLVHAQKQQQRPVKPRVGQVDGCHNVNPALGRLPAGQPTVAVISYNGVPWRAPTPAPAPSTWVSRSRDPMAVVFRGGVQPDSVFCVQQQKPSKQLGKLPAQTTCAALVGEASKLVVWDGNLEVKPSGINSVRDTHTVLFREPQQVLNPNTRIKITGKTREGQAYEAVHGVVQGLSNQQENRYNFNTGAMESLQISGRFLPSAAAWAEPTNILVSQPVKDKVLQGRGKSFRIIAGRHENTVKKLQGLIGQVQARITTNQYADQTGQTRAKDTQLLTRLQQALPKVQQKAQQFKAKGDAMYAEGNQLRALVVSVAGVPNAATVQTVNSRLAGEGAQTFGTVGPTMNATADATHGSFNAQVAGIQKDRLVTTVSFPAVANAAKGSRLIIQHRVPDPRDKTISPVTTIAGTNGRPVKLYRMAPEQTELYTEPGDAR